MIYIYLIKAWLFFKKEFNIQVVKSLIIFHQILKILLAILRDFKIFKTFFLITPFFYTLDTCGRWFNFDWISIFISISIQFWFHSMYKFISCFCINSIYTHNYHKLFCCIDVAFCAIVMSLVLLMLYFVQLLCLLYYWCCILCNCYVSCIIDVAFCAIVMSLVLLMFHFVQLLCPLYYCCCILCNCYVSCIIDVSFCAIVMSLVLLMLHFVQLLCLLYSWCCISCNCYVSSILDVVFCAIVMSLVFLMHYGFFYLPYLCLYIIPIYISASYWVVLHHVRICWM